ncbi:hypothetical protein ABBQ38_005733 [Trebouxia sp. C0009 RCD-2024]
MHSTKASGKRRKASSGGQGSTISTAGCQEVPERDPEEAAEVAREQQVKRHKSQASALLRQVAGATAEAARHTIASVVQYIKSDPREGSGASNMLGGASEAEGTPPASPSMACSRMGGPQSMPLGGLEEALKGAALEEALPVESEALEMTHDQPEDATAVAEPEAAAGLAKPVEVAEVAKVEGPAKAEAPSQQQLRLTAMLPPPPREPAPSLPPKPRSPNKPTALPRQRAKFKAPMGAPPGYRAALQAFAPGHRR